MAKQQCSQEMELCPGAMILPVTGSLSKLLLSNPRWVWQGEGAVGEKLPLWPLAPLGWSHTSLGWGHLGPILSQSLGR